MGILQHNLCTPWARQSRSCLARQPSVGPVVGEYHIKDSKQQRLMLRQLVESPVLTQLTCMIAEFPALRCAADQVTTQQPTLNATPASGLAQQWTARTLVFGQPRPTTVGLGRCAPTCRGRAVYGLLTRRSLHLYRPPRGLRSAPTAAERVCRGGRFPLPRPLCPPAGWAKVQSTTADASPPRLVATPAAGSELRTVIPRRRRRLAAALAAAAQAAGSGTSAPNSSSDEEDADAAAPATDAAAAAAVTGPLPCSTLPQPRRQRMLRPPPPLPGPCRVLLLRRPRRDAIETERRRDQGLYLKCLPSGPINDCPCPLHLANARDPAASRCFPYSS